MSTIRLALLLCDDFLPRFRPTHGDYTEAFRQFLSLSLVPISSDITFTLDAYDVAVDMVYPPDSVHYDGVLISGARASAYDDLEWINKLVAYLQRIIAEKPSLKLFGICFGHQIIARALGSPVKKGDWEISVTTVHLSQIGRTIFDTQKLHLQMYHGDQVLETPPQAYLLGSSDIAHNQGMVIFDPATPPFPADLDSDSDRLRIPLTSIHVLTLQAHPEHTIPIMHMLLEEAAGVLDKELVDDALSRVGLPTDAIDKVGKVIWGMLGVA